MPRKFNFRVDEEKAEQLLEAVRVFESGPPNATERIAELAGRDVAIVLSLLVIRHPSIIEEREPVTAEVDQGTIGTLMSCFRMSRMARWQHPLLLTKG